MDQDRGAKRRYDYRRAVPEQIPDGVARQQSAAGQM
jgi:hypothetical protein